MQTSVPLSALLPPRDNPRRTLDQSLIAGLAQSIKTDGVLQNLLVRPEGDGKYRVVVGKRRYLALQHLKKKGAIEASYEVPVEVRDDLEDGDALRIATVENVQREPFHPMDEAEAFARQLQAGGSIDTIAQMAGLSVSTVRRRLALATLSPAAKKAFRAGAISRTVAEALTLGSREQQRMILDGLDADEPPDADEIRSMLIGSKPSVSMAIFPSERYSGTLTTDLFADDQTTYFDDVDQFLALQRQAVDELAEEWRHKAAWVEVVNLYTVPWWHYRGAIGDEPAGVVINLHPSGIVEVHEGLVPHEVAESVVEATRSTPIAPRPTPQRPEFSAELVRYVAYQRSAAIQAALLGNPRKAKEVGALVLLLGLRACIGARLTPHACHQAPAAERAQRSYQAVDEVVGQLAGRLGFTGGEEANDLVARLVPSCDPIPLYEALGRLEDEDLDRLVLVLPILCFGEERATEFDTSDSLFNRIAVDLGVEMRRCWTPDLTFLSRLTRDQILALATDSGASGQLRGMPAWTKKRLVAEVAQYFAQLARESSEDEADRAAAEWLPGFFRFPATAALAKDLTIS